MKGKIFILAAAIAAVLAITATATEQGIFVRTEKKADIYHDGWIDFNKNGKMDVYEDKSADVEARVEDLLSQMTMDEKTMQMVTLYGYGRVVQDELPTEKWSTSQWHDGIGNIDEHLNGLAYHPQAKTEFSYPHSKHARAINEVQRFFVEDTRLGIPADFTNEGIRGLCHEKATSFPAQIGQGSTWDRELIHAIGDVTGREAKILGYSNVYSPILDTARDPRWGRTVECYSEDPYLVATLGKEMVRGIQAHKVVSTGKHYGIYSYPKGGRDGNARTDPQASINEVHEVLLRPFREAVREAGILGLMSSYNDYSGVPFSADKRYMTDLLNEWGFNGYIVSDSGAVDGLIDRHRVADTMKQCVYRTVTAGLNVRTNFNMPSNFVNPLRELVAEGSIPESLIDERVGDVLRVKFLVGLFDEPYVEDPDAADALVNNEEARELSLRSARESLVLLKNDGLLPVDPASVKKVLVTGPNAKSVNPMISRYGPSKVDVVTLYDGVKNYLGDRAEVMYTKGCLHRGPNWPESELYDMAPPKNEQKMIAKAYEMAREADLVIVGVGDDEESVGEGKSRTSLDLPGHQLELLKALQKTGKPIVVVLINGRPLTVNWSNRYMPAIIEAWFPSEFGGQALAEAIFGDFSPGGRLSISFPKTVGQIPYNFPYKTKSQADQPLKLPERLSSRVNGFLYPLGYGLSYTTFEYKDLKISPEKPTVNDDIKISATVTNTGGMKADEVVQLYFSDVVCTMVTYEKRLRGFQRITLEPGESRTVEFTLVPKKDLTFFDVDLKEVVEPGEFKIYVGGDSLNAKLKDSFWLE